MFEISKTFGFAAAHRLCDLPPDHKCSRIHGHNYRVTIRVFCPDLNPPGFVIDYGELDPVKAWLADTFDHAWLGAGALTDEDGAKTLPAVTFNPTAELLAAHVLHWVLTPGHIPALAGVMRSTVPHPVRVGVSETDNTWSWAR